MGCCINQRKKECVVEEDGGKREKNERFRGKERKEGREKFPSIRMMMMMIML